MVQKRSKRVVPSLDERFEFLGGSAPGKREALRAAQFEVHDRPSGRDRSLKLWRKTGTPIDDDLRQLWLHEMRQVQRVMSCAGAHEVIVDIVEFVEDAEDFGVLLEHAGHTLAEGMKRFSRQHWLNNIGAPRARSLLWRNFRRLVEALGMVHGQGLVHGRISADAVMTDGAEEPDFQLTGFEWSLWLSGDGPGRGQAKVGSKGAAARADQYSFAEDWRALGRLLASCLQTTVAASGDLRPAQGAAVHLSTSEASFVRRMVNPTRLDNLDAASLLRGIDDIVVEVAKSSASRSGSFILCFARGARLGEGVFDATDGEIPVDELRSQLDWVRGDLDGGARLLVPKAFDPANGRLRLVTANMAYDLGAVRQDGVAAWDVAVCTRVERRGEDFRIGDVEEHDLRQGVEVVLTERQALDTRARLGPDALDWSAYSQSRTPTRADDRGTLVRRALLLVQVVEAVVKALEIYPVQVLDVAVRNGRRHAVLRAEPHNDRDRIARKVGLTETSSALRRLFEEDQREGEAKWRLSRAASLGASRRDDVSASFLEVGEHSGRHAYWFEVDDDIEPGGPWFLRVERDAGTEGQIQRRLRAIKAMVDRVDLTQALDDPWRARRASRDLIDAAQKADKRFRELDQPKRDALVGLWETLPSYMVVGPPGVGKTHLVTEVIRRRFDTERESRLLLTAQGHDALDHLQGKVRSALSEGGFPDLIIVRSSTTERPGGEEDVHAQGATMLHNLAGSPLVAGAPLPLRERVAEMSRLASRMRDGTGAFAKEERVALNAMSSLVLDAANVVISTANSQDVERLVEAREQFDWVIVEEAAKATGPELVGPLMLAGRRLMIGDHHQLPPFEADRLGKLLASHALVIEALALAEQYVGPLMRDGEIAELTEVAADPDALRATADMALRLLEPFRSFVVEDERRKLANPDHRPVSSTLTEQRRMDPAIARVVSQAFYDGKLLTAKDRIERSRAEPPPFDVVAPLPASPLVVVDFPHVSRTGSSARAEHDRPRFHNPGEVRAVVDTLGLVRVRDGSEDRPSLVVLSFYKAQVEKLSEAIDAEIAADRLGNLSGFSPAAAGGWVSTVDGFQGNEADLVMLSLVRNNAGAGASSLGFLRDRRRMNVAMSRAKWKLVVVGSLSFMREAVRGVNPDEAAHDLSFLSRMDAEIRRLCEEKRLDGTTEASIVPPPALRGGPSAC